MPSRAQQLRTLGQSVWLDYIHRRELTSGVFDAQSANVHRRGRAHALNELPSKVARAHVHVTCEILHGQIRIEVIENPQLQVAEHVVATLGGKMATEL